jgi:hypothetical protein
MWLTSWPQLMNRQGDMSHALELIKKHVTFDKDEKVRWGGVGWGGVRGAVVTEVQDAEPGGRKLTSLETDQSSN